MAKLLVNLVITALTSNALAFGEPIHAKENFSPSYDVTCENENHHIQVSQRRGLTTLYQNLNYEGVYGMGTTHKAQDFLLPLPTEVHFTIDLVAESTLNFHFYRTGESAMTLHLIHKQGGQTQREYLLCTQSPL